MSRIVAMTVALPAGLARKGLDALGFGDPSRRDLTWDAVGSATGAAAASCIDRLLSPASPPATWARLDPRTPLDAR